MGESVGTGGVSYSNQVPASIIYPNNTSLASQLPYWRAALGRVAAGSGNGTILCVGDSTTLGYGSNATTTAMRYNGWPNILASRLSSVSGITSEANGWIGDGGNYGSNTESSQYDSRIVVGSGWSKTGITFPGGNSFTASSATSSLTFQPTVNVDTFVITYLQFSGLGVFSYALNGGSTTTVNTSGTTAITTVTVTGSLQSNILDLNYSSGGAVYIIGIDAYNSANKQIHIINGGWTGSLSSSWSNVISPVAGITNGYLLGQDLTIIQLGINDMNDAVSVPVFSANMQALITACKAQGDVILMTSEPEMTSNASAAIQASYQQTVFQIGTSNNIPVIDMYSRWQQSYALENARGMYYDSTHPSNVGYPDVAVAIRNFLLN
jgi:lysophospholipase L1-like esterase